MYHKKLKKTLTSVGAASVLVVGVTACGEADAGNPDAFPERNIEIFVGFGPGGGSDVFARQVAAGLEDIHDLQIQVVNMEGAGGANAIREAHGRGADGHTWYADYSYAVLTGEGDLGEEGEDMLQQVARFQDEISHLMVDPDRYSTWEEFEADAQQETLRLGGVGASGFAAFISAEFNEATDLDLTYVPFEGAGEQLAALQSGNIDAAMEEFGAAMDYIDSGEIISLMALHDEQLEDFPEVPTSVEKGIDVTTGASRGIMVHSDTDPQIVDQIEDMLEDVYESDRYQQYESESYLDYRSGWMNSEDYTEYTQGIIEQARELDDEQD